MAGGHGGRSVLAVECRVLGKSRMPANGSRHSMARTCVLVALGGNLPRGRDDPAETLRIALRRLHGLGVRVLRASHGYRNPSDPPGSGPDFVNAVALAETNCSPALTLAILRRVERSLGRCQVARSGPRTLDLDLIAYGNRSYPRPAHWRFRAEFENRARSGRPSLMLPHPAAHRRPFVLRPLLDVSPRWTHPALERRAAALYEGLPLAARSGMVRLT